MPSEERQFWYALTLFGSGLVLIGASTQNGWGVFLTLVGGLWLLYLERERIRAGLRNFMNGIGEGRQELNREQRDSLITQLSVLPPRAFGIVRDGLPDCVRLADQLHALFGSLAGLPLFYRIRKFSIWSFRAFVSAANRTIGRQPRCAVF